MLTAIVNGLHAPVFVKDTAGRYIYLNEACADVFGVSVGDMLGRTDAELLPAGDVEDLRSVDRSVISERVARTLEEQVTTHGERHTFLTEKYPWFSATGEVLGVIGLARDITDQRAAETALRESEERFRLLADTAPVLMWTTDTTGGCDFFNDGWLRFTGVPLEAQLGERWLQLVHRDDRAASLATFQEALANREPFRMEYRLRQHDGTHRWIQHSATPRFSETGEFQGYVGSCSDIHDAVLQQHAVEQSAAELEKLTAELESTVATLRRRTSEAEAARSRAERTERLARFLDDASRLLQESLDPRETLQSVANLAVPRVADRCIVHLAVNDDVTRIDSTRGTDPSEVVEAVATRYPMWRRIGAARVIRTGAPELYPEVTDEILATAAVDEEHLRLLRASRIRSAMIVPMKARGRVLGSISLLSVESGRQFTVDDLRLAEELAHRAAIAVDNAHLYRRAEDASRAKSEFLARMSHELRTPLNAIGGYTDLLELGIADEASRAAYLERIKASNWHLLSMIEEILTFSRLEAGTANVHREPVAAQDLVREAADFLAPAVRQKELELRLLLPAEPIEVRTDRLKVRQVLMNLLSNAVKFTATGSITVSVIEAEPDVQFRVADTGPGIRPEQMHRIFEPFWQAQTGTTRRAGGTGIGLAVAMRLAKLLEGELTVESTWGGGSTFTLRIPLSPDGAG